MSAYTSFKTYIEKRVWYFISLIKAIKGTRHTFNYEDYNKIVTEYLSWEPYALFKMQNEAAFDRQPPLTLLTKVYCLPTFNLQ